MAGDGAYMHSMAMASVRVRRPFDDRAHSYVFIPPRTAPLPFRHELYWHVRPSVHIDVRTDMYICAGEFGYTQVAREASGTE